MEFILSFVAFFQKKDLLNFIPEKIQDCNLSFNEGISVIDQEDINEINWNAIKKIGKFMLLNTT